jgi:hypothetical protein
MQPSVMLAHSIVGRRSLGILICGNASDHDSPDWRTMPVGIAMLVNAALHIVVRRQHPDWDVDMVRQLEEAAARRANGNRTGVAVASPGFGGATPPPMPRQQGQPPRPFDSIGPPARRATTPPRSFDDIGPPAPRATTPPRNIGGAKPSAAAI